MSRVYGEPVDVWVRDGRAARFVWRGRLYPVLRVLENWVVSREWWEQQEPDREPGGGQDRGEQGREPGGGQDLGEHGREPGGGQGRELDGGQGREVGGKPGEPSELEFWRVEASPGRDVPPATYELRRDAAAGTWLLARVLD